MEYVPIVGEDDEPVAPVVPITAAFRDKTSDLIRIVNNLTALAADDRVSRNKQQIADQNGNALLREIDALTGVAEQLDLLDDHGADRPGVAP